MDIFQLINADFATVTSNVELGKNPDGSAFGVVIVGSDSPQYLAENNRQRNEGLAFRRAVNKGEQKAIDMETPEGRATFDARFDANLTAQAVAVTVGWYGFTDGKKKEAAFDKTLVEQIFQKKKGWRDAVINAVNEEQRFLPKSAKN